MGSLHCVQISFIWHCSMMRYKINMADKVGVGLKFDWYCIYALVGTLYLIVCHTEVLRPTSGKDVLIIDLSSMDPLEEI